MERRGRSGQLGSWAAVLARRDKCCTRSFLLAFYDRLLISRLGKWLPFRGRIVAVRLHGIADPFFIRLGSSDWMCLEEIFIRGAYDSVCDGRLGQVRSILDLGANVGFSMRCWSTRFPTARIVGVEPVRNNAQLCRRNLGGSGVDYRLIEAFVGGTRRMAYLDPCGSEWASRMVGVGAEGQAAIQVMTVADVLQEARMDGEIDLVKCDIEGAEEEVFARCGGWIHRVRNLLIEVHGSYTRNDLYRDLAMNRWLFEAEELGADDSYSVLVLRRKTQD